MGDVGALPRRHIAEADVAHAQHVATLPAALGGLGLRSAIRTAPAAYWAAWADSLPELHKRSPAFAELLQAERTLLPSLSPSACALLRSQSGPQAGAWLTAIPSEPACALPPQAMLLALRRRLRLPLPLCASRCGPPGCGGEVDAFGDHALACTRTGLIARRAKIAERAWVRERVAREAVGPDGQVVQQWLAHTTAPNVRSDDRRRLDLVVYGATPLGKALCCDATLVSPLTRTGLAQPCSSTRWSRLAGRRAPKESCVPGTEQRPPTTRGARE